MSSSLLTGQADGCQFRGRGYWLASAFWIFLIIYFVSHPLTHHELPTGILISPLGLFSSLIPTACAFKLLALLLLLLNELFLIIESSSLISGFRCSPTSL